VRLRARLALLQILTGLLVLVVVTFALVLFLPAGAGLDGSAMSEAEEALAAPVYDITGSDAETLPVELVTRIDELEAGLAEARDAAEAARGVARKAADAAASAEDDAREAYDKAMEPCLMHGQFC
jgi:hypothetical protein